MRARLVIVEKKPTVPNPRRWLRDAVLYGFAAVLCLGLTFVDSGTRWLLIIATLGFIVATGGSLRKMGLDRRRLVSTNQI